MGCHLYNQTPIHHIYHSIWWNQWAGRCIHQLPSLWPWSPPPSYEVQFGVCVCILRCLHWRFAWKITPRLLFIGNATGRNTKTKQLAVGIFLWKNITHMGIFIKRSPIPEVLQQWCGLLCVYPPVSPPTWSFQIPWNLPQWPRPASWNSSTPVAWDRYGWVWWHCVYQIKHPGGFTKDGARKM